MCVCALTNFFFATFTITREGNYNRNLIQATAFWANQLETDTRLAPICEKQRSKTQYKGKVGFEFIIDFIDVAESIAVWILIDWSLVSWSILIELFHTVIFISFSPFSKLIFIFPIEKAIIKWLQFSFPKWFICVINTQCRRANDKNHLSVACFWSERMWTHNPTSWVQQVVRFILIAFHKTMFKCNIHLSTGNSNCVVYTIYLSITNLHSIHSRKLHSKTRRHFECDSLKRGKALNNLFNKISTLTPLSHWKNDPQANWFNTFYFFFHDELPSKENYIGVVDFKGNKIIANFTVKMSDFDGLLGCNSISVTNQNFWQNIEIRANIFNGFI